jgi:hypothetical protein
MPRVSFLYFQSNMNAFLTLRDNIILLLSLQVWQLNDRLSNNSQAFFDLLLADNQRRCQSDDVLMSWFGLLMLAESLSMAWAGLPIDPCSSKAYTNPRQNGRPSWTRQ